MKLSAQDKPNQSNHDEISVTKTEISLNAILFETEGGHLWSHRLVLYRHVAQVSSSRAAAPPERPELGEQGIQSTAESSILQALLASGPGCQGDEWSGPPECLRGWWRFAGGLDNLESHEN